MTLSEAYVDFLAGWASGAFAVMTCQPVDTILTRFQAAAAAAAAATTRTAVVGAIPQPRLSAVPASSASSARVLGGAVGVGGTNVIIASSQQLVRNFGITSLWRGASPMIGAVPIQNSLLMGGYGIGKQWAAIHDDDGSGSGTIGNSNNNNNTITNLLPIFVGGCTGGLAQSFLMSPVEYVKVRQQVAETNGSSSRAGGKSSIQAISRHLMSSYPSLWSRGLTATLWRDGIPHGIWFVAYEWCKTTMLTEYQQQQHPSDSTGMMMTTTTVTAPDVGLYQQVVVPIVSGAFAATVAWVRGVCVGVFFLCDGCSL
jgi:solute carrier family 25 carnitine/acylcarnitine transporter 20/29